MAHGLIATAGASVVTAATSVTASLYGWASFGASIAAILGAVATLYALSRKKRRRSPPTPPSAGASTDDWQDYSIRVDQWAEDLKDD